MVGSYNNFRIVGSYNNFRIVGSYNNFRIVGFFYSYMSLKIAEKNSDGSRPSDKGRARHPGPEIRGGGGGLKKLFFGRSGLSLV